MIADTVASCFSCFIMLLVGLDGLKECNWFWLINWGS